SPTLVADRERYHRFVQFRKFTTPAFPTCVLVRSRDVRFVQCLRFASPASVTFLLLPSVTPVRLKGSLGNSAAVLISRDCPFPFPVTLPPMESTYSAPFQSGSVASITPSSSYSIRHRGSTSTSCFTLSEPTAVLRTFSLVSRVNPWRVG